ncbi:MAG TPA: hypothetical protein PLR06_05425 [Cyclobacteriaceae bacterium]|nr:hypothetical protein [Cyclobacteriaceae bacterium]
MRILILIPIVILLASCKGSDHSHTVKVIKPINHKGYYKNSRWHKKLQYGRIRIKWFEKQGVKTVKMKG